MQTTMLLLCLLAQEAKPRTEKPNPDRAIYKEWCRMLRETRAAADRMKSKKAQSREEWFNKTFNEREDKILRKYKRDLQTLYGTLKTGVLFAWPTESPADRVAAQVTFDPKILRDEQYQWAAEHGSKEPPPPTFQSAESMIRGVQESANRSAYAAEKAPVVVCGAKTSAGNCGRKTVGKAGTKCYEHRR
jgi:adenine-specific DNA glycosylase